jgi:hypothetical protein
LRGRRCVLLNFLTCFWYYIATIEGLHDSWLTNVCEWPLPPAYYSAPSASFTALIAIIPFLTRTISCTASLLHVCAAGKNLVNAPAPRQWVASLYFITMTITTVCHPSLTESQACRLQCACRTLAKQLVQHFPTAGSIFIFGTPLQLLLKGCDWKSCVMQRWAMGTSAL